MKKSFILLFAIALLMITSCQTQDKKEIAKKPEQKEIDFKKEKAKISELLDLLASSTESGDIEMIEQIWYPKEDVILIGTENDEKLMGWSTIMKNFSGQFNSLNETLISITDQSISFDKDARTAWFFEEMNYNFIYKDKALSLDGIRFTGVFIKNDEDIWKLVQGHVSIPTDIDMQ